MHDWMRMMEGTLGIYDVGAGWVATWDWQVAIEFGDRPIYHDWWMMDGGHGGMTMGVMDICAVIFAGLRSNSRRRSQPRSCVTIWVVRFVIIGHVVFLCVFSLFISPSRRVHIMGNMASWYWMGISRYVDVWMVSRHATRALYGRACWYGVGI